MMRHGCFPLLFIFLGVFLLPGPGLRALEGEQTEDMKKELDSLRRAVERLEAQVEKEEAAEAAGAQPGKITLPGSLGLKISGQIRIREEMFRHLYTPADPMGDNRFDYAHMRTRLRFDLTVLENIAGVVEIQDVRGLGEPTVNDAEGADLKRGEMLISNLVADGLSVEMGRFVMAYGDHRLIGDLEWFDQGRSYDGFRVSYKPGEDWYADIFGVRLAALAGRDAEDVDFIGFYGGLRPESSIVGVEGYVLYYRDQRNQGAVTDNTGFFTLGCRAFGDNEGLDYTGELAYQNGDVLSDDLSAYAFALKGGYTLKDVQAEPRFGLELDYASGDHRPGDGDLQTFQTLFPTNHKHYGYADLMAWSNMWDYRGGVSCKASETVTLAADWHHLMLADEDGGWYNAGGFLIRPGASGASRHIGEELDLTAVWKPLKPLSFLLGWSHFMPGGFVEDTGRSRSSDFFYVQAWLKF